MVETNNEWPEKDTGFERMLGSGDHDRYPHMGLLVHTSMLLRLWRLEWRLAWASFVRIWSATKSSAHLVPPIWEMIILKQWVKYEWVEVWISLQYVYLSIIQCRHNFWKKFGRCPETCLEADGRADFTMCFAAKVLSFIVLDATKPFFVSWAHANKAVVSRKLMGGRAWLDQPSTRCL